MSESKKKTPQELERELERVGMLLQFLPPSLLVAEYTRQFHRSPDVYAGQDELIQQILAERRRLALGE